MLHEIAFVPKTLSEAQSDMNRRHPGEDSSSSRRANFHRYNAEMFRLAGEQLGEERLLHDDSWWDWCFDLQLSAAVARVRDVDFEISRSLNYRRRVEPCQLPIVDYLVNAPSLRFGEWIWQHAKIITLETFAKRSGLSLGWIRRVCSGRASIRSLAQVVAVADALRADREVAAVLALRDYAKSDQGWPQHVDEA